MHGQRESTVLYELQAAHVRKVNFVPDDGFSYDPDKHSTSTIYAGTTVQQASWQLFCQLLYNIEPPVAAS